MSEAATHPGIRDGRPEASPAGVGLPADFQRRTWRFLGRLALAMVALWVLWLPLAAPYRKLVVATGNLAFAVARPSFEIEFREFRDWRALGLEFDSRADVAVLVRRPEWVDPQGRAQHLLAKRIVTFSQPYASTIFLIALFGATRLPWASRLRRLFAAGVVLHAAMLSCVAIDIVHTFAVEGTWPGLPRWCLELLAVLKVSVTDWPAGVYLVPLVVWLVACWPGRRRSTAKP